MSAVLATASPRRIKATHRRRRKVAAGHFVQRYYDPQVGRFLSVDPVASRETGDNFNRYAYANNNPYKFKDPDGRESGCFSNGVGCGLRAKTAEDNRKTEVAFTGLVAVVATPFVAAAAAPTVAAAANTYGAGLVAADAAASQAGRQVASVAAGVIKQEAKLAIGAISRSATNAAGVVKQAVTSGYTSLVTSKAGIAVATGSVTVSAAGRSMTIDVPEFVGGVIAQLSGVNAPPTSTSDALGSGAAQIAQDVNDQLK